MTEEQIALARRAVACKGWRWMPGMLDENRNRVLSVAYTSPHYASVSCAGGPVWHHYPLNLLPDLTDFATLGCLLALVREAWGNRHLWVESGLDPAMWTVVRYELGWACVNDEEPPPDIYGDTEAEVLVAALEAAP